VVELPIPQKGVAMQYFEFESADTPTVRLATGSRDPEKMPDAAKVCCRQWDFVREFRLGEGTHSAELEATIKERVAAEGYHVFVTRPERC
jgi:hypothetical protein